MKLQTLKNVMTSKLGRSILVGQKHSPVILFGAGVIGVVSATVLACRASLKLDGIMDEHDKDKWQIAVANLPNYSEQDRKKDLVILHFRTAGEITRIYAPAAAVGILSIIALTGSHIILNRRNVAITAAYAALDRGFREYRRRVVDELGPEKDRQFRYQMENREIVEETKEGPVTKTVKQPGPNGASIYARFFDETSSSWRKEHSYNQFFLQSQQNYANDMLRARGHVFLNEIYDMLGLPRSKEGAVVGWVQGNGDDYVDFGIFEGDRESGMRFVNGYERSVLLDFNVDGIIYDKI